MFQNYSKQLLNYLESVPKAFTALTWPKSIKKHENHGNMMIFHIFSYFYVKFIIFQQNMQNTCVWSAKRIKMIFLCIFNAFGRIFHDFLDDNIVFWIQKGTFEGVYLVVWDFSRESIWLFGTFLAYQICFLRADKCFKTIPNSF